MLNDRIKFLQSEIKRCKMELKVLLKQTAKKNINRKSHSDCATEELMYNLAASDHELALATMAASIELAELTLAMKIAANELLQECLNS